MRTCVDSTSVQTAHVHLCLRRTHHKALTTALIDGKRVKVDREPAARAAGRQHTSSTRFVRCRTIFNHVHPLHEPIQAFRFNDHAMLTSDLDVEIRIKKASQAFGALHNVVCDRDLKARTTCIACKALVVTALLHGAEFRAMKESHVRAITSFHRRCVRTMCHVTMRHTRQFHIKTTTLEERLGVVPIAQSCHRRLLGWAGAVLRMTMDRLPRQMPTAWIPHPRAVGSERNWGQAFNVALKANGLDTSIKKLTEIAHLPRSADRNNPNPSTWLQTTKQGLSPRT